jgi:tRNA(fMet)-specific endonuclease VapC
MVKNEEIALNSNIVIDVLSNNKAIVESVKDYGKVYLPITVCGELLFGAKFFTSVNNPVLCMAKGSNNF